MHVIGTAGHVDHGKSTLVAALTGIHPDRLKEERERQMTIDLGFAWMTLPNGEEVGIVDVPGHRDFIENMLAGVGSIDVALFVVAADEGIMPQTREHLAIINLLEIPAAIVAITKIDLVNDPEWLELVLEELQKVFQGTVLENAPVIPVSAKTGEGLKELQLGLQDILREIPGRKITGIPRLPIDRVFSMAGFGTIVTGTLIDGILNIGDEVQIYPGDTCGKVRGLQTHKQKEETAVPGSRTAINISGVDVKLIQRGNVLSLPGCFHPSVLLDVYFKSLKDNDFPLTHHTEVKLFLGAAEILARTRLIGKESLLPGENGWIQLELQAPVIAVKGDHFILRRPSPAETIGGGIIVDPLPLKRHKRFDTKVIDRLAMSLKGNPEDILMDICNEDGILALPELLEKAGKKNSDEWIFITHELIEQGKMVVIAEDNHGDTLLTSRERLQKFTKTMQKELSAFHQRNPLRQGILKEELKSKMNLNNHVFTALVKWWRDSSEIKEFKSMHLSLPDFWVSFNPKQQSLVKDLLEKFEAAPYNPPPVKDCQILVGPEIYRALLEMEILIEVSQEVVFRTVDYKNILKYIQEYLAVEPSLSVAQLRDHYHTSRRYALAFLEYIDNIGVTVREGDIRKLKKANR